ncbi:nucleotide-binding oligomerization domain-containing protein 2 isoform X1 [Aquarana catesbeiana]|uniref:nucleotide-binding oligomerization domain-containing protein 2 isoform X1 n=1 Tax=Aquarana catesbeiana TaxID=8400 RepID=UPI003CC98DDC
MSSLHTVQVKRDYIVSTLARGSVDKYESLVDHLLSQNALNWEEYQSCTLMGQPLCSLVRDLLDNITCKGDAYCKIFLDALQKNETLPHEEQFCFQVPEDRSDSSYYLQCERPRIVQLIHNYIGALLQQLSDCEYISECEINNIQLPIFSPSQKARRLLDLIQLKGNEAARCVLEIIHNLEEGTIAQVTDECLSFHKKLKNIICAQTRFLSTYDGTENMCLQDVYTESILELSRTKHMLDHGDGSQSNLDLQNIFSDQGIINENADTIIILGDAGTGKSSLLQHIQHLWARGQAFQNFCFVFPFSCRRLCCITKPICLKALLFEQCCWPDRHQEEIFEFIMDHPSQVLIMFDGFDELKFSFTEDNRHCSPLEPTSIESVVFNLIEGNLMKDCMKVVTSRPDAVTVALRKYIKKEINLRGFSEEGIETFIKKHHNNPDISSGIISLVKSSSSLTGLCHIPVFCWIISKCHKELINCDYRSPQTMTDMYMLTLKHFLLHASTNLKRTQNILSERTNSVKRLGKIALSGLHEGLYVFSPQEIVKAEITKEDLSLGFLVISKNFLGQTSSQYYEFLHITFQCFFAALYIVMSDEMDSSILCQLYKWNRRKTNNSIMQRLPIPCLQPVFQRQTKMMLQNIEIRNLKITATFVAGLFSAVLNNLMVDSWHPEKLAKKCKTVKKCLAKAIQKHFKSIPPALPDEKKAMHAMPEFIWLIKCLYEMQDITLAQKAVQGFAVDHLKITYCGIGPAECTALAYVLKHLKNPVGIQLDHNSVGDTGIEQLIPCLHICHALYLRDNNITDKGLCSLLEHALAWPNFQKLALFNNGLTDNSMNSIALLLKNKQNLLSLRLGNNCITEVGGQILAEGLRENQSLKFLGLWGNRVGGAGAKAIADSLQNSKTLIWLSLVGNNIGSIGGQAVATMLKKNTVLEELWLDDNKLEDSDAISIAASLKENCAMKILKISNNNFSKNGVSAFAEALKYNNTITEIWLKGANLSKEDMETFDQLERLFLEGKLSPCAST